MTRDKRVTILSWQQGGTWQGRPPVLLTVRLEPVNRTLRLRSLLSVPMGASLMVLVLAGCGSSSSGTSSTVHAKIPVPNVIGLTTARASQVLHKVGLRMGNMTIYSFEAPPPFGVVSAQHPAVNAVPGSTVTTWVDKLPGDQTQGPYTGEVLPLGTTATLSSHTVPASLAIAVTRVFNSGPPTAPLSTSSPPFGPTSAAKWIGVQISLSNTGHQIVGLQGGPAQNIDLIVNGYPAGNIWGSLATSVDGCPGIRYPPLNPGASTKGCIAVPIPTRTTLKTLGFGLYYSPDGPMSPKRPPTWRTELAPDQSVSPDRS
jgi:PASTA domain